MESNEYINTCITAEPLGEIISSAMQTLFRFGLISLDDYTDEQIERMMQGV